MREVYYRCMFCEEEIVSGDPLPNCCSDCYETHLLPTLEKKCEWHDMWEYTDHRNSEGFWYLDTTCLWEYPEILDGQFSKHDDIEGFIKHMGFTFCPNCGNKIKFVENK